jgi:hypothetical protein
MITLVHPQVHLLLVIDTNPAGVNIFVKYFLGVMSEIYRLPAVRHGQVEVKGNGKCHSRTGWYLT